MKTERFGEFGGSYVAEPLKKCLAEISQGFEQAFNDAQFKEMHHRLQRDYIGRPSPLYFAEALSKDLGGARVYFKREDLNHTGSHKINNSIGQALLAKYLNKKRVIAETGAGQHGVAMATACALLSLECIVYMGAKDYHRQSSNVQKMNLLGATVIPVTSGSQSLKDSMNEALRDWVNHSESTYYAVGTAAGPTPFPRLVRELQKIIGIEARRQLLERETTLPDQVIACIGGGSNAIGLMHAFYDDKKVELIGVEAAGKGIGSGLSSAAISEGTIGVLHGNRSYYLQDTGGQVREAYSISAGLDYPGVGPEHALLHKTGRAKYVSATDKEALSAFHYLARTEGIIPALEPAHALAYVIKTAPSMRKDQILLMNLCGRGDKDMTIVQEAMDAH
ncbi:tryptophan synthase subunit beta [Parendozoicomonas sp. Alg238-R29]|uniref:tryptophan synthase subunit beta n=1 Tax=Parendozoicomonas sp. Alg238-R29 TaxID=2993446 RepID=UPI00248E40C9|nr:tryptophan synthase subunit beta [Parendozoicomonas sp. Alg238-R29]